jgi:hypothetical protein
LISASFGKTTLVPPEWCTATSQLVGRLLRALVDHPVDEPEFLGHLRGHKMIALERVLYLL